MTAIYVEILATKGSVPRDAGTAMKVTAQNTLGTIGGGALEHQAIAKARAMLASGASDQRQTIPLGPGLGQCCGGSVTLAFTRAARPLDSEATTLLRALPSDIARQPLWIWGAGHVGRAMVRHATATRAFNIVWVDTARERFPKPLLGNVATLPAPDMPRVMAYAPRDALHLILTYSHDIDLALCAAALAHGFGYCGLIGSATKWARFQKRLGPLGHDPTTITCPIGDPALGKHPDQIAAGTIADLLANVSQNAPRLKEHA